MEHVLAKKLSVTNKLQKRYQQYWGIAFYGCRLDRKPWKTIQGAGFSSLEYERFAADVDVGSQRYLGNRLTGWINSGLEYLIGPHVLGVAIK